MSATVENMTAGSLLVILGMAVACFSGRCCTLESEGRGGIIDCGLLQGVVFVGVCGILFASLNSYTMAGFDAVVCLLFVLGCVGSVGVCFLPSCVIIISSESLVSGSCF